jgi:crossover junction endodeoxyribonuclease RuvC
MMTGVVERSARGQALTSTSSIRIGIDLGNTGGVAELTASGDLVAVHPMPCLLDGTKNRPTLNAPLLAELIAKSHATVAYIEWVSARPTDGPIQAFSFGRARGACEGICASLGVRVRFLTPPQWKRLCSLPPGKEGAKDRSRSAAIARWPAQASLFALKKSDGLAESALIGLSGLMLEEGLK